MPNILPPGIYSGTVEYVAVDTPSFDIYMVHKIFPSGQEKPVFVETVIPPSDNSQAPSDGGTTPSDYPPRS